MLTERRFERIASRLGFLVDIGTLVHGGFSIVSAVVFATQSEIIRFPIIGFRLGPWFQFVLLVTSGISYVHFLRRRWLLDRSIDDPLSNTFRDFLLKDLAEPKRPLLLIPIFLFYAAWAYIGLVAFFSNAAEDYISGIILIAGMFLIFAGILKFAAILPAAERPPSIEEYRNVWNNDPQLRDAWIERIHYVLGTEGHVNTFSFHDNVGLSLFDEIHVAQINWALEMYFGFYESVYRQNAQLLVLSPYYTWSYSNGSNTVMVPYQELRIQSLP